MCGTEGIVPDRGLVIHREGAEFLDQSINVLIVVIDPEADSQPVTPIVGDDTPVVEGLE
jgi:hypothetical protein